MPKMKDSTLRALLAAEHADALAATSATKLSQDRATAQSYYLGDMSKDLPVPAGRSSAVSMDVSDTIEGMMPQLMDIFTGSDEVVRFEPVGPEDVKAARQETDYVNHVFMNQNDGFMSLYSMLKDALLSKVGIVKVFWEAREEEQRETYYDKTDDEYALLASNPDIEIIEHTAHAPGEGAQGAGSYGVGPDGGQAAPSYQPLPVGPGLPGGGGQLLQPTLHDVTVLTRKDYSCAKVVPVPPEEFGCSRSTRILRESPYCFHRVITTEAKAISQGYDPKQIKKLPTIDIPDNEEDTNRNTVDEGSQGTEINSASRSIAIVEHYVRMDYEGNNKPALYRVVTGDDASVILKCQQDDEKAFKEDIQPWDAIPFAAITPVPQTHRFFGRSIADLVMDIQKIKTALLRSILDNRYLANNPRVEVPESHASDNTLDDLLVSRPGGVVRTKAPGGLVWQVVPDISASTYPALEYLDTIKEARTGFSARSQGLDANALANQSATAANIAYSVSQQQIKMIAKIAAETGIKDMFWLLHGTIKKHGDKQKVVRLRNEWVTVDPRNWKSRDDITVHVGLGTGDKAQQMAMLMNVMNVQKELVLGGLTNIVKPENIYNSAKDLTRLSGKPDTETYFSDPSKSPPPPPQPDPKLIELQMKAQLEGQKAQTDAQLEAQADQRKAQIEQVQAQADIETQRQKTQAELAMAERKAQLEERLMLLDHELKREMQQAELQMKRELHEHTIAQSQMGMVATAQAHDAKMQQIKSKPNHTGQ